MKISILLLSFVALTFSGMAQYHPVSINSNDLKHHPCDKSRVKRSSHARKTTAIDSRWYVYADYMDQMLTEELGQEVNWVGLPMWNDTTSAKINYSTGTNFINMPSIGMIFDPSSRASYNNPNYYGGEMMVGPTDAYTVDSVNLSGIYAASAAHTSDVDTIRLAFVTGYGNSSSSDNIFGGALGVGGHYGAATFVTMRHDSVKNMAGSFGPSIYIQDILLDNTTYADTNNWGRWSRTVRLTTPLSVLPNRIVGMSLTYINGQTPAVSGGSIVHDFVTNVSTANTFMPAVLFASDGTNPQWFPQTNGPSDMADSNTGLFKKYPGTSDWTDKFIPFVAWSSGGGTSPSHLQFPDIGFHVSCESCGRPWESVSHTNNGKQNATAYPNPADNEVKITFNTGITSTVSVSIINMLGQVVATQNMSNVAAGTAVFNSTKWPAGIYTYTVMANGTRTTGRVVLAH